MPPSWQLTNHFFTRSQKPHTKKHSSVLVWIVEVEARCSNCHHAGIDNCELACCDHADVNPTSKQALCAELDEARLLRNAAQSRHHGAIATSALLVHLGQETISWLGDGCSCDACNNT